MSLSLPNERYERKYVLPGISAAEAIAIIRRHPALFREPYPERTVNNLYLDTPDLHHYLDHMNGATQRVKIRIRWYGEFTGAIARPALEFKSRQGTVSGKETHPFPAFSLNGAFPHEALEEVQRGQTLPERARFQLAGVRPVLGNRYRRRYFCSGNGALRMTVDWNLEFVEVAGAHLRLRPLPGEDGFVIVELKYGSAQADEAAYVASQFPFRLSRCSKYILGAQKLPGAFR